MAGVGFLLAWLFDINALRFDQRGIPLWAKFTSGGGFGMIVVALTAWITPRYDWAQRLSESLGKMLGERTLMEVFVFALASGFGEEVLFRGTLQQLFTIMWLDGIPGDLLGLVLGSLLFGILHTGPERAVFLPWTVFAVLVGACFGVMYWWSGDLVAPVTAHFTINFFNLQLICNRDKSD